MNDRTDREKQEQTAVGPASSMADAKSSAVNRRNILLGGTTLAAAAIGASAPLTIAQAQAPQQPAPSAGKPNIRSSSATMSASATSAATPTA